MSFPEVIAATLFGIAFFVSYWFRGLLWNSQLRRAKSDDATKWRFFTSPRYMASTEGGKALKDAAHETVRERGENNLKWILVLGVLAPLLGATVILIFTSGQ